MMVSHDRLVAMKTWKKYNLLARRDYSKYFYNEFEYGVRGSEHDQEKKKKKIVDIGLM